MKTTGSMAVDADPASQYECMRQCVLDGVKGAGPARWGAALLIRTGMAAWLLVEQAPEQKPPPRVCARPPPRPSDSDVVCVLAGIVLNTYWKQYHAS